MYWLTSLVSGIQPSPPLLVLSNRALVAGVASLDAKKLLSGIRPSLIPRGCGELQTVDRIQILNEHRAILFYRKKNKLCSVGGAII